MAINKTMRKILKALSYDAIEVEASRHLANLKSLDPMKIFYKTMDYQVYNGDYPVPVRVFFPNEKAHSQEDYSQYPVLLFLHGGGWVTESIDNYERICSRMAADTNHLVIAVEYRLAPEHPFPTGLEDCYAVAKALFQDTYHLQIPEDKITIIGDSAGGNLTAALSLMARDRGEFMPKRQILIYPALSNDYSESSPFASVKENGSDYLLTSGKMRDYLELYQSEPKDRDNPYFAPIIAENLSNQPATLILTAEFDPLRDEGEAYARKLSEAGNKVELHRIPDALHGYFALGIKFFHVKESFDIINHFLEEN